MSGHAAITLLHYIKSTFSCSGEEVCLFCGTSRNLVCNWGVNKDYEMKKGVTPKTST
jgi:hypothetical protein